MRWLIVVHRYCGIALGWLIVVWCLSGIVMMYVPYPEATFDEHIESLPALELSNCCAVGARALPEDTTARAFSIEMLGTEPTLRLAGNFGGSRPLGLHGGQFIDSITDEKALEIARSGAAHRDGRGEVAYLGLTTMDQWTVGYFEPGRALHHVALGDPAGTRWYIDEHTGEVVQNTTRRERIWNWVGSVAHWLYPTALRQTGPAWANLVIYTTVAALFLTVVGVYIGLARLRLARGAPLSPFRGMALWHHYLGLVFGLLTLTWLLSGLLSMNPWGLLSSSGAAAEVAGLRGGPIPADQIRAVLENVDGLELPAETTYIESAPLLGELFLVAYSRDGTARRYAAASLREAALTERELEDAARHLRPDAGLIAADMIHEPDAYYYDQGTRRGWPVYRVMTDDPERTLYYLDSVSGQLVAKIDSSRATYRWLFSALHSLDFARLLRLRPVWDVVMIALLAGVALVAGTGTYIGIRYLARRRPIA